ncbi:MAG: DUF1854 domain-containing protein [Clostridia bacterium]|nr:DUF1854 domain-containing protein [Clostridia bacterium]
MTDIQTSTPKTPDPAPASDLSSVVRIQYLDDSNARFTEQNGFLSLAATVYNAETQADEEKTWERIFLHAAFPFDMPTSYISVQDKDQKEIGMIRELSALSPDTQKILQGELARKYYAPKIERILSVKERYGFSYWRVDLVGVKDFSFTVQDTYRSMLKVDHSHIFILDVDGNRFEIPDVEALDRQSYKKIELYL